MAVIIREMTSDDASAVSDIYIKSWKENYGELLADDVMKEQISQRFSPELQAQEADNPDIISLVAMDNDEIVGVSSSSMDERNQAWIDRMHIVPAHQGKGISKLLMNATLAKHSGLQSIALKVIEGNERAISIYERHGFFQTDKIENDAEVGGATTIIMSRTLPRN